MVKVVQSTGNADAILIRKLSIEIMKMEQQDSTAVDDLAFLQLLDQNFAEGFLFRCKMDVKGMTYHSQTLWVSTQVPTVFSQAIQVVNPVPFQSQRHLS